MKYAWVIGAVAAVIIASIVAAMSVTRARNWDAVANAAVTGLNTKEGFKDVELTAKREGDAIVVTLTNRSARTISIVPPAEYMLRPLFIDENGEVSTGGVSGVFASAPDDLSKVVEDVKPGESRTTEWKIRRIAIPGATPDFGTRRFSAEYYGSTWTYDAAEKKYEISGNLTRYSNPINW